MGSRLKCAEEIRALSLCCSVGRDRSKCALDEGGSPGGPLFRYAIVNGSGVCREQNTGRV